MNRCRSLPNVRWMRLILILDARYERILDNGVIAHQAVLIAIGINMEGR